VPFAYEERAGQTQIWPESTRPLSEKHAQLRRHLLPWRFHRSVGRAEIIR
jgi:hypothetical protein